MVSQVPTQVDLIHYPDSDGQPMADNTLQFRWIVILKENIDDLFAEDPTVFVAGDLLWYPVEGQPEIRVAPDVMVAFGRPKGERGSYMQFREAQIPPQVVIEILSPGNTRKAMVDKWIFYDRYEVEEYIVYDPDRNQLRVWVRSIPGYPLIGGSRLRTWTSPRLGIRFEVVDPEMQVYRPDGRPFEGFQALRRRAEAAAQRAEAADQRAEAAAQRAEAADQRATEAEQKAERLAQQLRELGLDPDSF